MKKLVYILLVCAAVAAVVLILLFNKKATDMKTKMVADISTTVAVKMEAVTDSSYSVQFTSNGTVEALRDLHFMSDVAGRIVKIYADGGSRVSKGSVLVQLDDEMLRADVISNKAAFEGLKKDYERFKNANAQGGVSDQQLDNIHTQMVAAESRYITATRHLADASIKAPISGVVYKRYVEVGGYVNPGAMLFDIIDDSKLKVRCFANEKQRLHIKQGQAITVSGETFAGELLEGKITFIGDKADRSLNFPVEVTLTDSRNALKAGMYVSVHFDSGTRKSGILIPRNAIVGSIQAANVFVVKNGIAQKQSVTTGNMVGEKIEVLQGLQKGDSIVVAGLINVSDGAKVRNIK